MTTRSKELGIEPVGLQYLSVLEGTWHTTSQSHANRLHDAGRSQDVREVFNEKAIEAAYQAGIRAASNPPMQPLWTAGDGVVRFVENRIVSTFMYRAQESGAYDLNRAALGDFTEDEHMQFAQLIGYSLSGYGGLSYVSNASWDRAHDAAVRTGLITNTPDPK